MAIAGERCGRMAKVYPDDRHFSRVLLGFRNGIACALPERESCEKRRMPGARSTNGERTRE